MPKDAILIFDAFLNSSDRIEIFKQTLESVKKFGLPIMVISNFKMPNYLIDQFDYYIYSKDNILFTDSYEDYPNIQFYMDHPYITYINNSKYYQKHGLSVLSNLKITTKFAESLGFKKFIRMEWDFIISNSNINMMSKKINDFIKNDKRAFFLLNPSNAAGMPDIPFFFWMVDLKFWNENFPDLHSEQQYKEYILAKNNSNFFEIAERILFLSIKDKLTDDEIILENDFIKFLKESKINAIMNDINFSPPSENGCCKGLVKIIRNGIQTGELALFTWNRNKKEVDNSFYEARFCDSIFNINHSLSTNSWMYSIVDNFNLSKFPITLKVNESFEKIYYSINEINSVLVIK